MARRAYAGQTADQRRALRKAALFEATLQLLASEGVDAVTMRSVCTTARLNDRYFYEHFRDRDDLLVATASQVASEGTARILVAMQDHAGDLESTVRVAMGIGLAFLTEDPRRGTLLVQSHATAPLRQWRSELVAGLAATVRAQGTQLVGDSDFSTIEAHLTALTLVGGFLELVTTWLQGQLDVDEDHLIDFLTSMLIAAVPTTDHPH
jgi:AcrR family transcriptional regulator